MPLPMSEALKHSKEGVASFSHYFDVASTLIECRLF